MINKDRPVCVLVPWNWESHRHHELRADLSMTLSFEYPIYDENDQPKYEVEACMVNWIKEVDGKQYGVKCMEPAFYYITVQNACGIGTYCEYHRPRVKTI